MIKKIEHLGIAVKNLDESNELFEKLLGVSHYKIEEVESEGVKTSFFQVGETKIELLEATRLESPIAKFIEKKGEGIHHMAFDVEQIENEIERLTAEGFQVINDSPKNGADNKRIVFLHPKTTNGVLIELCEDRNKN
ncbi:MAG: methylmalonyl-CoA epimerase [Mangrovimonas sp.]|nr:methylmalonyl-CoA epimerase [Mangrovimonas sp.]